MEHIESIVHSNMLSSIFDLEYYSRLFILQEHMLLEQLLLEHNENQNLAETVIYGSMLNQQGIVYFVSKWSTICDILISDDLEVLVHNHMMTGVS